LVVLKFVVRILVYVFFCCMKSNSDRFICISQYKIFFLLLVKKLPHIQIVSGKNIDQLVFFTLSVDTRDSMTQFQSESSHQALRILKIIYDTQSYIYIIKHVNDLRFHKNYFHVIIPSIYFFIVFKMIVPLIFLLYFL